MCIFKFVVSTVEFMETTAKLLFYYRLTYEFMNLLNDIKFYSKTHNFTELLIQILLNEGASPLRPRGLAPLQKNCKKAKFW